MAPILQHAGPIRTATQKNGEILSREYVAAEIFLLGVTLVAFEALSRTEGDLPWRESLRSDNSLS
jgi:hypothetical protein